MSATQTLWTPRPLHSPPASPLSLSLLKHGEAVAAVRRHRDHRAPLASPTRPKAPPRRPRPLCRATRHRTPQNIITAVVFYLEQPRSPAPVRRPRRLPRATNLLIDSAVSSSLFPLFFSIRPRPLAPFPTVAETRRHLRSSMVTLQ